MPSSIWATVCPVHCGPKKRWNCSKPGHSLGARQPRPLAARPSGGTSAGSDRFALDQLGEAWIGKLYDLPATIDVNAEIYAVHGTPADDNTYLLEDTDSGRMAPRPERPSSNGWARR